MRKIEKPDYLIKAMEKIKEIKQSFSHQLSKIERIEGVIYLIESYLLQGKIEHNEKLEKDMYVLIESMDEDLNKAEKLIVKLEHDILQEIHKKEEFIDIEKPGYD
ncbi:hypothetical protein C4573_04140 [Candidatus Woesearchaeota archaeon]|nr:MAG: hypothetical protein C4573_04140 [Candidatus Woesearchaeota archaeon]